MIPQAVLRRLGPWLIGLFLIAQTCGVVQLLSEHTAHLAESHLVLADEAGTGNTSHAHHHFPGDADGAIQHHELQDLTGAPACLISGCELPFNHVTITAYVSDALIEHNPVLLERPPRLFLSV
jgi:hypothetical protein